MPEFIKRPFSSEELRRLETALSPSLVAWAIDNPHIRDTGTDHRLIRDLAALHAHSKAVLATGRLSDFTTAMELRYNLNGEYRELQYLSPKEIAGIAAGQLAVSKLLTTWYRLERDDFTRLPTPRNTLDFADTGIAGLQEAVCTMPRELGITTFSARDVYHATMFEAEAAVEAGGPEALAPFMAFPEYP